MNNRLAAILLLLLMLGCTKPREAGLYQQKMCADRAEKVFKDDNDESAKHFASPYGSYASHYSPSRNICFIELKSWINQDATYGVYDAFGKGKSYGSYWANQPAALEMCKVEEIKCKDKEGFDKLTEEHFGVSLY
jgi:hypothetical protein